VHSRANSLQYERNKSCFGNTFFFVETPFYLQSAYIHSAKWCEDWELCLEEGHSLVAFRSY
jgi:hypothetical protein